MDLDFNIHQWNQPTIKLMKAPYQLIGFLGRQMCTRNRTRNVANRRAETEGLEEIDKMATQAETKKMSLQDRANLNIVRIGAAWTRTAAF